MAPKSKTSRRKLPEISPSVKEARLTRTHSFASPATHGRIEVEINFPFQGVGEAVLAPLSLRYIMRGGKKHNVSATLNPYNNVHVEETFVG